MQSYGQSIAVFNPMVGSKRERMDYKLFDDHTKEFLGWLRNQGFPAAGNIISSKGRNRKVTDVEVQKHTQTLSAAIVFAHEI